MWTWTVPATARERATRIAVTTSSTSWSLLLYDLAEKGLAEKQKRGIMSEILNRRSVLKWAGALPLMGSIAADAAWQKARAAVTGTATGNIYSRIGVRSFINARGTWTYLSASLELPEVRAAKQEAAKHFVDIFELQRAVGKRLAELSGAESGMVTSGAAGAIASATAACIAGTDPEKIWQLPDTTGLKSEVIMFGGRSAFDSARVSPAASWFWPAHTMSCRRQSARTPP